MSAHRSAMVQCDNCGDWIDVDGGCSSFSESTITEVRATARRNGWKRRKGQDLCPGCGGGNESKGETT